MTNNSINTSAADGNELDKLLEKTNLQSMLEFETQIFLDIIHKDGLVIAAKGLNLNLVILNILKVYCDPGNLIMVLNATESEEKYYINKLRDPNVHSTTFSTNVAEREDVYLSGGIHFVTTRILVVDMLKKRIPTEKITGFLVLRGHRIFESCQEAFALRLYRQNNKTGFVKSFSNSAQSFTVGFGHVERVMRALFVKELYIWPRFHSVITECLKKYEPEVIELHIPISKKLQKIQTHILDLMNLTVKELKRLNNGVELQEITVENCLTKKFHKILQSQLDVIWHQLSGKSCQLVAELKTLRHLILTMLYSDSVTFYCILNGYRTMEYAQTTSWVLLEPAELLFSQMNSLVFNEDKEFDPELCPKWEALLEILKVEIPNQLKKSRSKENTILILCSDNKTCHQLNQILTNGPRFYLLIMALKGKLPIKNISKELENSKLPEVAKVLSSKEDASKKSKKLKTDVPEPDTSKSKEEHQEEDIENFQSSYLLTMNQTVCNLVEDTVKDNSLNESGYIFEPFTQMENMNLTQICESISAPKVLIQTFKGAENYINLQNTLEDLNPNFIIMYHCNITSVREIEMYEAHRQKDVQLKVYFLIHADTVEEQSYLTTLRREKEAFEYLIETKSTMVVPENQDGKTEQCTSLQRELVSPVKNTREGGKEQPPKKQVVIVDMREFRSELPPLIHKRGIDIEPVTITVGDYILTPDICVERKSLSDLIGSLNSGRLYQQCTQMARYYSKPMLLIEFDQNKPFGWQHLNIITMRVRAEHSQVLLDVCERNPELITNKLNGTDGKAKGHILRQNVAHKLNSLGFGEKTKEDWRRNTYMLSNDVNSFNIQQKLLLLTLHFPKLKLIWSPSPYASAQLFEELKLGKDEPDIEYAIAVGNEQDLDIIETKYNSNIYDFVQKLPGITSKNIEIFLRNEVNMDSAVKKSEDELKEVLGNTADARALYSILHENHKPKEGLEPSNPKGKSKARFKYCKK